MKSKMGSLKKIFPAIAAGLLFIAGVGVLAYPTVSDRWNARVQSRAVASYNEAVACMAEEDYSSMLEAAEKYNEALKATGMHEEFLHPGLVPGYEDTLDVTGTGIMGTITIDKIGVDLPIYHGTGTDVLAKGAGHLQGSSLPVGGKGRHSVISAHRGLPSSKLFTGLDRLEIGDMFEVNVPGETLNYEVDHIVTVLPSEIEELYPREGEDYCTLMTCTPYGINTHRLLVRGRRVYLTPEKSAELPEEAERALWPERRIVTVVVITAAGIILVLLLSEIFVLIFRKRKFFRKRK